MKTLIHDDPECTIKNIVVMPDDGSKRALTLERTEGADDDGIVCCRCQDIIFEALGIDPEEE